ncbi:hypothetical protein ACFYUV_04095 [Nonomuraea sp. NPDC003560]|uniref:hypothetical protein n=1 Tax=Nonomuraea sp. NPDC003560 TaxID=3364341 RepID=UPI00369C77C6
MTTTAPNPAFEFSPFDRDYLTDYAAGYHLAAAWLDTRPPMHEVHEVARIHLLLDGGGTTGNDTLMLDADHYQTFIAFLADTKHARKIRDGVKEMADINARQGTDFPSWPARCMSISFDEDVLMGFVAACYVAVRMR